MTHPTLPHREQQTFLLNHDPSSLLSLLTSPLLVKHSTSTITTTKITDSSSKLLSSSIVTYTLFIPAFSIDDTTLGVAITHTTTTTQYPLLTPPQTLQITRFSRTPGTLVQICDDAIINTVLTTPKRRTVTTQTLSSPLTTLQPSPETISSITKSEFARVGTFQKPIPEPPSHALDFSKEALLTLLYTGNFHGAALLQYLYQGIPHRHTNLKVSEEVVLTELRQKVIDDAVMDVLARGHIEKPVSGKGVSVATERLLNELVGTQGRVVSDKGVGRRERNRVAAAKSNRKRQFRNRWLRVGVVVYRLRVGRLKQVRQALIRERYWLRDRVRREIGGFEESFEKCR